MLINHCIIKWRLKKLDFVKNRGPVFLPHLLPNDTNSRDYIDTTGAVVRYLRRNLSRVFRLDPLGEKPRLETVSAPTETLYQAASYCPEKCIEITNPAKS